VIVDILKLIGITFVPIFELRGSIPYGLFALKMNWIEVFIICVVANFFVGIIVFLFLDLLLKIVKRIKFIESFWNGYVEKTRNKIESAVEKYGEWAVAIFIGIPLPGSGVWSGALASFLIGLTFKKYIIADLLGVIIAGIAVTIVCLTGSGLMSIFIKVI